MKLIIYFAKRRSITAESLKNKLLGKEETGHMLIQIFKDHNRKMEALVDKELSKGMLDRYETSLRHTQEFLHYHHRIFDIDIRKINHEFISEYDLFKECAKRR